MTKMEAAKSRIIDKVIADMERAARLGYTKAHAKHLIKLNRLMKGN